MNLLENNKECCHFISDPSKIGLDEFKNDCTQTPRLIFKVTEFKNW